MGRLVPVQQRQGKSSDEDRPVPPTGPSINLNLAFGVLFLASLQKVLVIVSSAEKLRQLDVLSSPIG
ncbi:hypothetical protein NDU88_003714 [Pleurodeles waltl]|uniref:Uncharacterized protein n=1 Tax=Pleurodeles waltl TaxID=8319 RepID=A0AAV7SGP4_PLEWA|nr:hypothetical protein NDU88_003714 [Pleurodeles waltl]